jgi:NAD(P)-dependent dehydrogenase (short-subunit alcohol dehydrogenase family)
MEPHTHEVVSPVTGAMITIRCNRCRKRLKVESSVIRGIGPVCAKRALRALGANATVVVTEDNRKEIFEALDMVNSALTLEEATLDHDVENRAKLLELYNQKASRTSIMEVIYAIFADVCNQLPTITDVADAVTALFSRIGASDEGDKARKRLERLAAKAGNL